MMLTSFQAIVLISYIIYSLRGSETILIGLVVMIFRYQWELQGVFQELEYASWRNRAYGYGCL